MRGWPIFLLLAAGCAPRTDPFWKDRAGACMPCHAQRRPIARNHNYRCDTCHGGRPGAKQKDVAHRDLIPHPQDPSVVKFTCQKCHNEKLGKDVPYDAQFVQDVLISHGDYAEGP